MRRSSFVLVLVSGCIAGGAEAPTPASAPRAGVAASSASSAPASASGTADVGATSGSEAPSSEANAKAGETTSKDPPPAARRITTRAAVVLIRPEPKSKSPFIGSLRYGSSVALRSIEPVRGDGCRGGFYAIEPRGYVCNDASVSLEPTPRSVEAGAAAAAVSGPFPYRYAISNGAPMYNRIPHPDEQLRRERPFGKAGKFLKQPKGMAAHEDLAVLDPIPPSDPVPPFLADGKPAEPTRFGLVRQKIPLGSMLSFTRAFEAEGRTWLLSPDMTLVPADRVRAFRPSTFRGVKLGGEGGARLPLAWMRKTPRPKQQRGADGFVPTGASWPLRSFVGLTGRSAEHGGRKYLETTEPHPGGGAAWILEEDATVVEPYKKMPSGIPERSKWFLVSITQGTLVAYEGLTAVYATLISPGAGGVPVPGTDPVKMSTTPLGTFPITFKDRATTMSPDRPDQAEDRTLWLADVPHTQYFNPPFALHAAYWHERFGEPTSAGCVNLSPIDAELMFAWSDPPVPEGWQGATGAGAMKDNGAHSWVVVRR